jgi:hypothetical protein
MKPPIDFAGIGRHTADLYNETELYILRDISDRITAGADLPFDHWRRRVLRDARKSRKEIRAILEDVQGEADKEIEGVFRRVYFDGLTADKQALNKFKPLPAQFPLAMIALAVETQDKIGAVNGNILRRVDDIYREAQGETVERAMARGLTRVQASREMLNNLARRGATGFIDKKGRQWDAGSYAEMCMRTNAAKAYRAGFLDAQRAAGNKLVYVSAHWGTCPLCAPWEGQILQID